MRYLALFMLWGCADLSQDESRNSRTTIQTNSGDLEHVEKNQSVDKKVVKDDMKKESDEKIKAETLEDAIIRILSIETRATPPSSLPSWSIQYRASNEAAFRSLVIGGQEYLHKMPKVCGSGVKIVLQVGSSIDGQSPNYQSLHKRNEGGPIGFRKSQDRVWIGADHSVSVHEFSYFQNDDFVFEIQCPSGIKVEVENLCIDQTIPEGQGTRLSIFYSGPGSDLVTNALSNSQPRPRVCSE